MRRDVWVLEQFTRWQAVNWDYAGELQKAQMDVAQVEADRDFRLGRRPRGPSSDAENPPAGKPSPVGI